MQKALKIFICSLWILQISCLPLAVFYQVSIGNKVLFKADLSIGNIQTYIWDFGDGTDPVTTNERTITYAYPQAAWYKVKLTVIDKSNRQDSVQNLVYSPFNDKPTARFVVVKIENDTIFLEAKGSKDSDGTINEYFWSLGETNSVIRIKGSSIMNYTYERGGFYNISLYVQDNSRANSSIVSQKVFVNRLPSAAFTFKTYETNHLLELNASLSKDFDGEIISYDWDFGDKTSLKNSSTALALKDYILSGIYPVSLKVTDNLNNSTKSSAHLILIDIPPKPTFKVLTNIGTKLTATAKDSWADNNSSISTLIWDWNDGSTPLLTTNINEEASHDYLRGDWYNVTLTVTDNYGLSGKYTEKLLVNTPPFVSFYLISLVNDTIQLDPSSSWDKDGNLIRMFWDFGNGDTRLNEEVVPTLVEYTFPWGGNYNICLTGQDNLLNETSFCQNYFVNQLPTSDFIVVDIINDTVSLIIDSQNCKDPDGYINAFEWHFGDGTIHSKEENATNITYTYTYGGYYNVSLVVTDNLGQSHSATRTIRVNTPPSSKFEIAQIVNSTILLTADKSMDPDGFIETLLWDFGDNTSVLSKGDDSRHQLHTYRQGGSYVITLSVTDNMNTTTNYSQVIFADTPPEADFNIMGILGNNWIIVSAHSYPNTLLGTRDMDGQVIGLIWNFGDGSGNMTNNTYATQLHQYNKAGNFTITLYAQDNNGIVSTKPATKSIYINNPPFANISLMSNKEGLVILEGNSSADFDGSVSFYCWNMGDGSIQNCQKNSTQEYLYDKAGTYNVSLVVIDNLNASSQTAATYKIFVNQPPIAIFTINESLPSGFVRFESQSLDLDGVLVDYLWDFGDGFKSRGLAIVDHVYKKTGIYNVTLTVVDDFGAQASISLQTFANVDPDDTESNSPTFDASSPDFLKVVNTSTPSYELVESKPEAFIQLWIQDQTVFLSAERSKGPIIHWTWDLGDGSKSTEKVFNHTYTNGGMYPITLTVTDNQGETAKVVKVITVASTPVAFFKYSKLEGASQEIKVNLDASFSFDFDSTIKLYKWNMGDDKPDFTSTKPQLNYTFATQGLFTILLIVENQNGKRANYSRQIYLSASQEQPVLIETGLPSFVQISNAQTQEFLAFTYDAPASTTSTSSSNVILTNESLPQISSEGDLITTPNLILMRNPLNKGYIIRHKNGLALQITNSTILTVQRQNVNTTAFQLYSFKNFYQIVDPKTGYTMGINQNNNELAMIQPDLSTNAGLWNLISFSI